MKNITCDHEWTLNHLITGYYHLVSQNEMLIPSDNETHSPIMIAKSGETDTPINKFQVGVDLKPEFSRLRTNLNALSIIGVKQKLTENFSYAAKSISLEDHGGMIEFIDTPDQMESYSNFLAVATYALTLGIHFIITEDGKVNLHYLDSENAAKVSHIYNTSKEHCIVADYFKNQLWVAKLVVTNPDDEPCEQSVKYQYCRLNDYCIDGEFKFTHETEDDVTYYDMIDSGDAASELGVLLDLENLAGLIDFQTKYLKPFESEKDLFNKAFENVLEKRKKIKDFAIKFKVPDEISSVLIENENNYSTLKAILTNRFYVNAHQTHGDHYHVGSYKDKLPLTYSTLEKAKSDLTDQTWTTLRLSFITKDRVQLYDLEDEFILETTIKDIAGL